MIVNREMILVATNDNHALLVDRQRHVDTSRVYACAVRLGVSMLHPFTWMRDDTDDFRRRVQ